MFSLTYKCTKGHSGVGCGAPHLYWEKKRGKKLYVSSVLLPSLGLVSGHNFEKVPLLAKGMNFDFVHSTHFARMQTFYALPGIREMWNKMEEVIWKFRCACF